MSLAIRPRIAIVGKGAIGGLLAFKCETLGLRYQLLLREGKAITLEVSELKGQTHGFAPAVSNILQPDQFDLLILPVKAYQVVPVLTLMKPFIQPHHVLVLLHNGMGTIGPVRSMFPNNALVAATTSYGAYKYSDLAIMETGLGQTHLGWLKEPEPALRYTLESLLSSILPPSTWHTDITSALWQKLAINAVINPLTAIYNIKNGQLVNSQYQSIILNLCEEISAVLQAIGYPTEVKQLVKNSMQVIAATAENYSSMQQDLHNHRPTEIEFINGYVLDRAGSVAISTPANKHMLIQVKLLESST